MKWERGRQITEKILLNIDRLQDEGEEHLEHLTIWLSNELSELNIERVEVIDTRNVPKGTKGIPDIPVWGQLLIEVLPEVIPSVVSTVQSWLRQDEGRSITLEVGEDKLLVTGISSEQQNELISAWLNRHNSNNQTNRNV